MVSFRFFIYAVSASLLLLSCRSTYPRPEFAESAPDIRSSESLLRGFRGSWPSSGTLRHSALLEFRGIRVSALGMCSFDSSSGEAALAMFTTTGMKILQVGSDDGVLRWDFRLKGIEDERRAAENLIGDVKGVFIHPKGAPDYRVIRGNALVFGWREGDGGSVELVFGVPRGAADGKARLMEKFFLVEGRSVKEVFYYDYSKASALPSRIRVENGGAGYDLTLKSIDGGRR